MREAIGDKFPKHIYHSIVCIGALIAHRDPDRWAVDAVGAPHVGDRTEKELIAAFCDKVAGRVPQSDFLFIFQRELRLLDQRLGVGDQLPTHHALDA